MSKDTKQGSIRKLEPRTRLLRCKLTKEELLEYGGELAQSRQDIVTEEALQASMKQQLKSRLAAFEATSSELSTKVARGEELRDVKVEPRLDFKVGEYYEVRTDTGEEISQRPITEEERQENLEFNKRLEPKKQPAKKGSSTKVVKADKAGKQPPVAPAGP